MDCNVMLAQCVGFQGTAHQFTLSPGMVRVSFETDQATIFPTVIRFVQLVVTYDACYSYYRKLRFLLCLFSSSPSSP